MTDALFILAVPGALFAYVLMAALTCGLARRLFRWIEEPWYADSVEINTFSTVFWPFAWVVFALVVSLAVLMWVTRCVYQLGAGEEKK